MPMFSVIVPAYNAEKYLTRAVSSLVCQDGVDVEVVIVDDGSQDATADVAHTLVNRYCKNVTLLRQANQGVSAARNTGIAHSTGEYVAFLDADDVVLRDSLHLIANAVTQFPDADCIVTDYYTERFRGFVCRHNRGHVVKHTLQGAAQEVRAPLYRFARGQFPLLRCDPCAVWTGAITVRRTTLETVGGFNTNLELGEDTEMWRRLLNSSTIWVYVDLPTVVYRRCLGGLDKYERVTSARAAQCLAELAFHRRNTVEYIRLRAALSDCFFSIAYKKYMPMMDFAGARRWLRRALRYSPRSAHIWRQLALCCLPKSILKGILTLTHERTEAVLGHARD
jgi:glycosyltransferase involved in cell wall biosynthesis